MEFNVKSGNPEKQRTACIVLGVYEARRLSTQAEQLDQVTGGYLSQVLRTGDIEGKLGQSLFLYHVPNILAERILLIGCGKERDLAEDEYKYAIKTSITMLDSTGSLEAVNFLTNLHVKGHDTYWNIRHAVELAHEVTYSFDDFKSHIGEPRRPLKKLTFALPSKRELPIGERALLHGSTIAKAITLTKDLSNTPANIATPSFVADSVQQLALERDNLSGKILGEAEMQSLQMNAYLAVSQGSKQEAKLASLHYYGAKDKHQPPIILIGKGVTFDSGGLSLKSSNEMMHMKYDMSGAASVYGIMHAVAELQLPLNVIGLMPMVENMPSGNAFRPGDIITSMSGKTIEVLNTDAEGRLILCDTLTYAETFNPEVIIDIATLTGATISALGHHISALLSNSNPLTQELLRAGEEACDQAWQLPMNRTYQSQIDSHIADIKNIGDNGAGTITAACFLSRFITQSSWAHIDIAGTAWSTEKNKGATGRPCAQIIQYLLNKSR